MKSKKTTEEAITLEEIARRKRTVLKEIRMEQNVLKKSMGDLFAPIKSATKSEAIMRSIGSGFALIDGFRFGIKAIKRLRGMFRE